MAVVTAWLATLAIAVGGGWWGARSTLEPPKIETTAAERVFVKVVTGTAGRTMTFGALGRWEVTREFANSADGVVTSVSKKPGDLARSGDVLYAVNLVPVVALPGVVPAFRDMGPGASGPDVRQLQRALKGLGYDVGTDGKYGKGTAAAVKLWQKKIGVQQTGTVARTSVLFIPTLPARITFSEQIKPGGVVGPGAGSVQVLAEVPSFAMEISPEQANLVPLDAPAIVDAGDGQTTWPARLGAGVNDAQTGMVKVPLLPVQGESLCGATCSVMAGALEQTFAVKIVIVPEVTGAMVPQAAVQTLPDGSKQVVTRDGTAHKVTVKAEANGRVVVEGVPEGTEVELFVPVEGQG